MPQPVEPETQRRPRRKSLVVAVLIPIVGVALVGGGWGMATAFRSPAQVAAAAAPPPASIITTAVSKGVLADQINTQGSVQSANVQSLSVGSKQPLGVVTSTPVGAGTDVHAGDVVLEINGLPLFVLPGAFPFYRDLAVGDTGRDVRQLQEGLNAAGYHVNADGVFGPGTATAVERLYKANGYVAPRKAADAPNDAATEQEGAPSDGSASAAVEPAAPQSSVSVSPSSFIVTSTLPASLRSAPGVGLLPEDASIVLISGDMVVVSQVIEGTAALVSKGMAAQTTVAGKEIILTLDSIGTPDDKGQVNLTFNAASGTIPPDTTGTEAVVAITREVVAEDALIVPSVAVASRGAKRYVLVEHGRSFTEVAVRELGTLGGQSAISPLDAKAVVAGDKVRVD